MALELKDNKGNTYNIGLINNTMQNNVNLDFNFNKQLEFKGGLIKYIGNKWKIDKIKKYATSQIDLEKEKAKYLNQMYEQKMYQAEYLRLLQQRINCIDEPYLTNPRLSILEPTVNALEYNIGEEQIREMFTNLLLSEIDTRKKQGVLPAYIHIIQELSMEDAKFLVVLKSHKKKAFSIMTMRNTEINSDFGINIDKIIVTNKNGYIPINEIIINNLERLGLIKISELTKLKDCDKICENLFNLLKYDYKIEENRKLSYSISTLDITDFGKEFIDICCS